MAWGHQSTRHYMKQCWPDLCQYILPAGHNELSLAGVKFQCMNSIQIAELWVHNVMRVVINHWNCSEHSPLPNIEIPSQKWHFVALSIKMHSCAKYLFYFVYYWNFVALGLTHWGRDKIVNIFQTTFSNVFSWMKMYQFWLSFLWSLFPGVQLTIFQHWFR